MHKPSHPGGGCGDAKPTGTAWTYPGADLAVKRPAASVKEYMWQRGNPLAKQGNLHEEKPHKICFRIKFHFSIWSFFGFVV